ncbi:type II secretion system protein GspK [Erwinia sp. Leaf53]|uniref:type II secretion system protein GspK n=1 Tax=Erwinia sp. Leaf53 TaxID=1736225 RepID=UPI0006F55DCC|nr:type II secretion system protein GspK [Erwinia sp. Leaf53]KQN58120.1 hypothetical protein ASF13_04855 [Erwinia sp. Leaf53]
MNKRQRGMAVLTVLLLIALMTLLAVTAQDRFQQALHGAYSGRFMLQSAWSLRGAEEWLLLQPPPPSAQQPQQLQLEDSVIHYQWRDRQACFNLNALGRKSNAAPANGLNNSAAATVLQHAGGAQREDKSTAGSGNPVTPAVPGNELNSTAHSSVDSPLTAAQRLFIRLLRELDVLPDKARQLTLALSAQLHKGAFIEPSQLRDPASSIDAALWARLAPLVCTLPSDRLRININGLTEEQLPLFTALFDGALSAAQAGELLSRRPPAGWKTLTAMLAASGQNNAADNPALLLSTVDTKSTAWELLMWTGEAQYSNSLRSRLLLRDKRLHVSDRLYGLSD